MDKIYEYAIQQYCSFGRILWLKSKSKALKNISKTSFVVAIEYGRCER
jgi:hypothetical protein